MMNRVAIVALIAVVVAVGLLAGCPKPQDQLQGAPSSAPMNITKPDAPAATPKADKPGTDKVAPAKPAAAKPAAASDTASCPVLGTTMAKKDMIPYAYKGKTYYFCCAGCVTQFKANPEKYIKNPAKPLPLGAPMPSG